MKKVPLFENNKSMDVDIRSAAGDDKLGKTVVIGDTVECVDSLISSTGEVVDIHNGSILLKANNETIGTGDEFNMSEKGIMKEFPEFDVTSMDMKIPYYMYSLSSVKKIIKKA